MHPTLWLNMFQLDPAVSVLEKIIRPIVVYFFLVVVLRLAGKRELAQLNPFDLVVLLTLSNTVQNAIIGNDNSLTGGVIGASTLLAVNYLVVRFLYGHDRLDRLVEGEADYLVREGRVLDERLAKELISRAELQVAARRQGLASLEDVEEAVLEPGGSIVFTPKKPQPDQVRQTELLARLDALAGQLRAIEAKIGA